MVGKWVNWFNFFHNFTDKRSKFNVLYISKASYNIWWKFRHHFRRLYIQIIYCSLRIIKCLLWITMEFMIPCIDASHRYHKFVTIKFLFYVLCVFSCNFPAGYNTPCYIIDFYSCVLPPPINNIFKHFSLFYFIYSMC